MSMMATPHTLIIGAGIGGLTTAALLVKAGHRVTVLEAHVYPGGSAGTFYHQGFRFDAGATLAGGFSPGGPHARVAEILNLEWPVHPVDPAWIVHLPDGRSVTQWANSQAWEHERQLFFPGTEPFWTIQERLAEIAWDISSRPFPWPPRSLRDISTFIQGVRLHHVDALRYVTRTIGDLPLGNDPLFRTFLDGQLLISAQTTADHASALYGSAALDLPRRGVNHVAGGIGSLATTLAAWIRAHGGEVLYRQRVRRIEIREGRAATIHTEKGLSLAADHVVANVTPWALQKLLGDASPRQLNREIENRHPTWGAFTLYLGLDQSHLPGNLPDHHQIIMDSAQPLGEGNSVFLSISDSSDSTRAPAGMRAATLSTHTRVEPWWALRQQSNDEPYIARRQDYAERLIQAAETIIPDLRQAIRLELPGTPVTFEYYTGRPMGMVGGFAQSSVFSARGPQTGFPNLWLVGDSIFPGQSTAGTTLGAMRVAAEVEATARRLTYQVPAAKLPAHRKPAHD